MLKATPYEPFPYEGSSTSEPSEGGFAKIAPSLFFLFSFSFFVSGSLIWGFVFWGVFFGGWGGVGVLPGMLPDKTGNQWEMSNLWGGDKPSSLFSILQK